VDLLESVWQTAKNRHRQQKSAGQHLLKGIDRSQGRLRAMSFRYSSDLTDAEWKRIEPIFDRLRFDEHDPHDLLNAVFFVVKTGSQ
jgi:hypothetical protein